MPKFYHLCLSEDKYFCNGSYKRLRYAYMDEKPKKFDEIIIYKSKVKHDEKYTRVVWVNNIDDAQIKNKKHIIECEIVKR